MALIYDVGGIPTLSIADADGSSRVIDFGSKWPLHAIWSPPTGERLLVHAQGEIGSAVDLYTVRADGSDLTAFGLPGESTWGPWYTLSGAVWAPDGATIAYNSLVEDPATQVTTFNVELVAADGSNPRALPGPADPLVNEGWPSYSPDGKWIVVQHWTFSSESDEGYNTLAIMPADGSAPAREFGPRFPGGERADIATTWSPDGTSIIVDPLAAPTYEVRQFFLVDLVTGDSEEIPWAQEAIAWQRVQLR